MRFGFIMQVVVGVILALVGVLFTLQNFGVVSIGDVQMFWPLVVVAFGLSRLFDRPGLSGWVLILAGGVVQVSNLGLFVLPPLGVVRSWPVLVVLVGLWEIAFAHSVGSMVEGFAIACLGLWLQLSYFGVVHLSSFRPWPLVLAAVGGVMVGRGVEARRVHH